MDLVFRATKTLLYFRKVNNIKQAKNINTTFRGDILNIPKYVGKDVPRSNQVTKRMPLHGSTLGYLNTFTIKCLLNAFSIFRAQFENFVMKKYIIYNRYR